jgi:hypothetical protein
MFLKLCFARVENRAPNKQASTVIKKKLSNAEALERVRETIENNGKEKQEGAQKRWDEKKELEKEKNELRRQKLTLLQALVDKQ